MDDVHQPGGDEIPERRHAHLGPPSGLPERRAAVRRATDAIKMSCPFCGASESAVVRSAGAVVADKVRRRRECADCHKRFPTSEIVDVADLKREMELEIARVTARVAALSRPA